MPRTIDLVRVPPPEEQLTCETPPACVTESDGEAKKQVREDLKALGMHDAVIMARNEFRTEDVLGPKNRGRSAMRIVLKCPDILSMTLKLMNYLESFDEGSFSLAPEISQYGGYERVVNDLRVDEILSGPRHPFCMHRWKMKLSPETDGPIRAPPGATLAHAMFVKYKTLNGMP